MFIQKADYLITLISPYSYSTFAKRAFHRNTEINLCGHIKKSPNEKQMYSYTIIRILQSCSELSEKISFRGGAQQNGKSLDDRKRFAEVRQNFTKRFKRIQTI